MGWTSRTGARCSTWDGGGTACTAGSPSCSSRNVATRCMCGSENTSSVPLHRQSTRNVASASSTCSTAHSMLTHRARIPTWDFCNGRRSVHGGVVDRAFSQKRLWRGRASAPP